MSVQKRTSSVKSGVFLIQDGNVDDLFCPENFTEEQRLLRSSIMDFVDKNINQHYKIFDSKEGIKKGPALLEELGSLGYLGVGVPEEYGGFTADFSTQLAFGEVAYAAWSFGLTSGVQTSLGVAPLLLYGNKEQKDKYLPGIVSAAIKSCYCLTEPSAGSDANAGKTRAILNKEGTHYILNGQKMWITNSGFADLFIVFAKLDEDTRMSCLLVEKSFGGIRLGAEEEKMGIRGSSTRQVFFEDVPVPKENILGERGKGFKIALNTLNTGRIKMSATVTGTAKRALQYGADYAAKRQQFGRSINQFDAIQAKLADMCQRIFAMESVVYRIGGEIDKARIINVENGMDHQIAEQKAIADFAMECAMAKVHNTEGDAFVIDEALQIHGGMGYSSETPIETMYRNQRINRIYEGTNEINRMLSIDMLLRNAMKGKLPLLEEAQKALVRWRQGVWLPNDSNRSEFALYLQGARTLIMVMFAKIGERLLPTLKEEQQIMMLLSDILTQFFVLESVVLRNQKNDAHQTELRNAITKLQLASTNNQIQLSVRSLVPYISIDEEDQRLLDSWYQLEGVITTNPILQKRVVGQAVSAHNGYPFETH